MDAKSAMALLGIRDRESWRKLCRATPDLVCRLPGLSRPRYRRHVIEKLLRPAGE